MNHLLCRLRLGIIAGQERIKLHLSIVEAAMDLADIFRQFDTSDEDLKVAQLLGMRTFNAFGASLKLEQAVFSLNRDSRIGLISDSSSVLG